MVPTPPLAFLLAVWSLSGSAALLHPPRNVRLTSHNMNLVLQWDPPEDAAGGDLVYTAESRSSVTNFTAACVSDPSLQCDIGGGGKLHISQFGVYTGRVRAQRGDQSSEWAQSQEITLDKHTVIGPPSVSLLSNGAILEVLLVDPELAVSTVRRLYIHNRSYNITYWKDGQPEKARNITRIQQEQVVLDDLEPLTRYCVRVQIDTMRRPEFSEPSDVVCESTSSEAKAPWVPAVVMFIVVTLAIAALVVLVVYRKRISHFLCPKDTLPQHLNEYLLDLPNPSIYTAMKNSLPPHEIFDPVSIIAKADDGRPQEATGGTQPETERT